MKIIRYPCKNCKDRHLGCHSSCEKYLKAKATRDEANHRRFIAHNSYSLPHKPANSDHALKTHKKQRAIR